MLLLGITGTDGAGKGTVVEYLVAHAGFVHYSARAIFQEVLRTRGEEATRANLRLVANELRAAQGDDFLITYYLKKTEEEKPERVIIESIRAVAEAQTLKKNGGILLAVDADQYIRYERVQKRRSSSDQVSFAEFKMHEELETNDPDPHGMQKRKVMAMAEYVLINNADIATFQKEIKIMIQKILNTTGDNA